MNLIERVVEQIKSDLNEFGVEAIQRRRQRQF